MLFAYDLLESDYMDAITYNLTLSNIDSNGKAGGS